MKKILFILLLTIPFIGFGQSWEKTFGGSGDDEGYSLQQTTDGGYIVCGRTKSFGNGYSDIYLIKTNGYGDSLWTKVLGGVVSERGYSVQQTILILTNNTNNIFFILQTYKIYSEYLKMYLIFSILESKILLILFSLILPLL